ncbi:MAG TPA: hypothetical protein VFE59_39380 [Trebonia sp.]|nr:hypothetical protein [Trebonia sp.]
MTAAVTALKSRDEHFSISVELAPQVRTGLPYRDLPAQQHLTWWATDNLGNCYLGEQGSWDPAAAGAAAQSGSGQPWTPAPAASTSCPPPPQRAQSSAYRCHGPDTSHKVHIL